MTPLLNVCLLLQHRSALNEGGDWSASWLACFYCKFLVKLHQVDKSQDIRSTWLVIFVQKTKHG